MLCDYFFSSLRHPPSTYVGSFLVTLARCRNLKFVKDKFQGSPDVVKGLCGSLTDSHPIIFRWLSLKGGSLNLVELFDQAGHLHWHSPWEFGSGFFL